MATRLDVAARLAEARQAVDDTQSYVWASHLLGYQNPDLTLHPAQVRDRFSSEDGMDLRVLDADGTAVQAVAAAADEALTRQRDQLAALASAWQGAGAASAEEFLRRHCDTAEIVAASARTAAEALAGLRDTLWAIVDAKVAAVTAIDDRRRAERPAWLAAADTVTTGAGDRAAASELVDQQIKPFVDNDIRNDWLTAVRTAIASITSSYDAASAALTSVAPVRFDVPGDFGPDPGPLPRDDGPPARDPATATSSPAAAPPVSAPSYPSVPAMSAAPPATAAMPAGVPTSPTSPTSAAPAAPTSGLDGLGQRLGDDLGDLLSPPDTSAAPDAPVADPPGLEDPPNDPPPDEAGDNKPPDDEVDENDCAAGEHVRQDDAPATAVDDAALTEPPPATTEPPPPPAEPLPPLPEAVPPEAPVDESKTPCEIAADELPKAGQ